jgi:hypothetical protein
MNRFVLIIAAMGILFAWILNGCSTTVQMTSSWNDKTITIDGSDADWGTSLNPVAHSPVAVGIRNDGEFLYVCLSTQDPFLQAQILNRGLTLWFDPKGGEEEAFGIHFPLRGENTPRWNPREPLATNFRFFQPSFQELALLGPEDQQEIFSVLQVKGIKVTLGASEKSLVYELQVPLRSSAEMPHAVGIIENHILGIGFQTPEFGSDRVQGPSGRASARTGGGRRGGSGGGGAGADLAGANRPEPLDLWTKVVLISQKQ